MGLKAGLGWGTGVGEWGGWADSRGRIDAAEFQAPGTHHTPQRAPPATHLAVQRVDIGLEELGGVALKANQGVDEVVAGDAAGDCGVAVLAIIGLMVGVVGVGEHAARQQQHDGRSHSEGLHLQVGQKGGRGWRASRSAGGGASAVGRLMAAALGRLGPSAPPRGGIEQDLTQARWVGCQSANTDPPNRGMRPPLDTWTTSIDAPQSHAVVHNADVRRAAAGEPA